MSYLRSQRHPHPHPCHPTASPFDPPPSSTPTYPMFGGDPPRSVRVLGTPLGVLYAPAIRVTCLTLGPGLPGPAVSLALPLMATPLLMSTARHNRPGQRCCLRGRMRWGCPPPLTCKGQPHRQHCGQARAYLQHATVQSRSTHWSRSMHRSVGIKLTRSGQHHPYRASVEGEYLLLEEAGQCTRLRWIR